MTIRELRYLVALANRAHFGRAAEECHVSQPTLSTQIRKLEQYLAVTLIERNAKSFALTPIGQEVVEKARRIVAQVDELLATTRRGRGPLSGPLNFGVIPTLAPYLLPKLLPLVKSRYQTLQLVVHEDLTGHLLERLQGYQIDAALLALPLDGDEFEELPLFDEPFWFACPPCHPLAQLKAVTEADLCGEPMLLLADGHCLRGQALAACGQSNREEEEGIDDFRAASLETICQLVSAGFGCTLLPALAARAPRDPKPSFVIRPLHSPHANRRIGLVWRRGYPKAQELAMLGELVRNNPPSGTLPIAARQPLAASR
ncbi:MAG: LysR substrate-binding domain-containing protein [Pseudomonadota bacterium]|nr:LysR substrate-binding domain-containing protein [Pseudomonadota bacterium]